MATTHLGAEQRKLEEYDKLVSCQEDVDLIKFEANLFMLVTLLIFEVLGFALNNLARFEEFVLELFGFHHVHDVVPRHQ